jgi:hypothetical protein
MFTSISWKEYFGFIAILLAIYYTIFLVYYKVNLLQVLTGGKNTWSANKPFIDVVTLQTIQIP